MKQLPGLVTLALWSLALGCANGPGAAPGDDDPGGKADGVSGAASRCRNFEARAQALSAPIDGLTPSGDLPLPTLGPDDSGVFHPPAGYTEGGTFAQAIDQPQWWIDPSTLVASEPAGSLRVVEWNVERGNHLDGVIRVMKRLNADVWLLNETDLYGHNSGNVVVGREIARALGYSYYTGIEFYEYRTDRQGTSGNSIVSRYPILDGYKLDVPMMLSQGGYDWSTNSSEPRCGRRNALGVHIDVPSGSVDGGWATVHFVSFHAENKATSGARQLQFQFVTDNLVGYDEPTVLGGDFNTVSVGEGPNLRQYLSQKWSQNGAAGALRDCSWGDDSITFSAAVFLHLRIDWMLVQPGSAGSIDCPTKDGYSVQGNDGTSDHKPVVTRMAVP